MPWSSPWGAQCRHHLECHPAVGGHVGTLLPAEVGLHDNLYEYPDIRKWRSQGPSPVSPHEGGVVYAGIKGRWFLFDFVDVRWPPNLIYYSIVCLGNVLADHVHVLLLQPVVRFPFQRLCMILAIGLERDE